MIGQTQCYPKHLLVLHLQKCTSLKHLKPILATIIKSNNTFQQDSFFINQFVMACSHFRRMDYALEAFDRMVAPNIFVYNAMIRGFILCSSPSQAFLFYMGMFRLNVHPTSYTYSSLIKACVQARAMAFGFSVHGQVLKMGFASQVFVQTALVGFYAGLDRVEESSKVFNEMTERDVFSWTTMISVLAQFGDLGSAKRLFEEMPERSTVTWNTMIIGFARSGDVDSAACLFNKMPLKDLVSWTSMISCYSQNKQFMEAVETFMGMRVAGVLPDEVTMATVISACAHLGALHIGEEVHHCVVQNGLGLDVYIGSALIDMYAKCGSLGKSLMVFFKLNKWNLFCWNSVIEGLAVHGRGRDALRMFGLMEKDGETRPNGVTFVSILSACTHVGLVEEGHRMFSNMTQCHNLAPEIEHYGCMVDLLSRAGLLQEALNMIQDMTVEPNSVVWGALLGGCKIHNNLAIGRIAVERLTMLVPDDSGHHILFVNMCADSNQWSEVAQVRGMMKERGVQKSNPGHSWIEMDGKVHEFKACDDSHPMSDEIYLLLVELYGQLKLAGASSL